MIKLMAVLTLLTGACFAQAGNTVTITASGAPTGTCSFIFRYIDSATGNEYNCKLGAWNQVGGGGSTAFSAITAGTNTAALVIGSGGSLSTSGTGTIAATSFAGTESHTATNASASLDFTTCITSSHTVYLIVISELILATDSANINFLVSTDGGSTFDNTATHYSQEDGYNVGGSSGQGGTTSQALINLTDTASSGVKLVTNLGFSGTFTLMNPASSSFKQMVGLAGYERGFDSGIMTLHLSGFYLQTTAVNAFRITTSAGNIVSGTVSCTPVI